MQRMTGIDPMFLYSETPSTPMEVAYTCVFDPSTSPEGYAFAMVHDVLEERLPKLKPFRKRLIETPLGLDHPRWVDDPEFDLDNHLHRDALPAPGGEVELRELAAEVMGRALTPGQPPWEMHVIEGLRDGKIGLIAKLHHAAIDGVSGVQLMAQLLDVTPDVPAPIVGKEPWRPPALPSGARMLTQAVPQLLTSPLRALRAAREVGRTAFRMAFHSGDGGTDSVSIPVGAPAQFCAPITARRSLSFAEANLTDVLALKDHLGVTLNDVVLAACSGAMRSYLSDHDQETTESLVAVVPVSLRHDSEGDALGNRLSAMFIPLGSDQEEPLDRLDSVVTACDSAKVQERSVGYGDMASAVSDAILPAVAGPALRLGAQLGAVRRLRPANVVISNVPGPRFPMYFAGMRMEEVYPIGPVVEGVGLNITVQTYLDSLFIGLNACPKVVPDVESLARAIVLELGNLMRDASSSRPRVREPQLVNEDVPRKSSVPKHTAPTPKALVTTVGSHQTRHRVTSATR